MSSSSSSSSEDQQNFSTRLYYCHSCAHQWMTVASLTFRCPRCSDQGFIEELATDFSLQQTTRIYFCHKCLVKWSNSVKNPVKCPKNECDNDVIEVVTDDFEMPENSTDLTQPTRRSQRTATRKDPMTPSTSQNIPSTSGQKTTNKRGRPATRGKGRKGPQKRTPRRNSRRIASTDSNEENNENESDKESVKMQTYYCHTCYMKWTKPRNEPIVCPLLQCNGLIEAVAPDFVPPDKDKSKDSSDSDSDEDAVIFVQKYDNLTQRYSPITIEDDDEDVSFIPPTTSTQTSKDERREQPAIIIENNLQSTVNIYRFPPVVQAQSDQSTTNENEGNITASVEGANHIQNLNRNSIEREQDNAETLKENEATRPPENDHSYSITNTTARISDLNVVDSNEENISASNEEVNHTFNIDTRSKEKTVEIEISVDEAVIRSSAKENKTCALEVNEINESEQTQNSSSEKPSKSMPNEGNEQMETWREKSNENISDESSSSSNESSTEKEDRVQKEVNEKASDLNEHSNRSSIHDSNVEKNNHPSIKGSEDHSATGNEEDSDGSQIQREVHSSSCPSCHSWPTNSSNSGSSSDVSYKPPSSKSSSSDSFTESGDQVVEENLSEDALERDVNDLDDENSNDIENVEAVSSSSSQSTSSSKNSSPRRNADRNRSDSESQTESIVQKPVKTFRRFVTSIFDSSTDSSQDIRVDGFGNGERKKENESQQEDLTDQNPPLIQNETTNTNQNTSSGKVVILSNEPLNLTVNGDDHENIDFNENELTFRNENQENDTNGPIQFNVDPIQSSNPHVISDQSLYENTPSCNPEFSNAQKDNQNENLGSNIPNESHLNQETLANRNVSQTESAAVPEVPQTQDEIAGKNGRKDNLPSSNNSNQRFEINGEVNLKFETIVKDGQRYMLVPIYDNMNTSANSSSAFVQQQIINSHQRTFRYSLQPSASNLYSPTIRKRKKRVQLTPLNRNKIQRKTNSKAAIQNGNTDSQLIPITPSTSSKTSNADTYESDHSV